MLDEFILSIFFLKRLSIHAVRHDNLIAVLNHSHNKQNFACNIILHVLKDIQLFSEFTLTNLSYTHWRRFDAYVLLRLRVQNRRKKWNFPLNFCTMRKLSELYSGIFQNYWLFNHLDVHLVWTTSETLQN